MKKIFLLKLIIVVAITFSEGFKNKILAKKIPVIYCSDLFHPHDDPDDHFDIVSIYAFEELDIKGIVLDQGKRQKSSPGTIPLTQLNSITGRNIPSAPGLSEKLTSIDDKGLSQIKNDQKGVELILSILKNSKDPVTIITVGSLRDVAAAYNRDKELFKKKVGKLLIFIGEASAGTLEWNVSIDQNAFRTIMNSGLPIWWVPCFDGGNFKNKGNASFWKADHKEILKFANDRITNFFIYALLKKDSPDPLIFLENKINERDKEQLMSLTRNLWCTAVFTAITERKIVKRDNNYMAIPLSQIKKDDEIVVPFRFIPVSLYVNENSLVVYRNSSDAKQVLRYQIVDKESYAAIMTSVTANLIGSLDN